MDKQTIVRIKEGLFNVAIGPETIALMPTGECNLRCAYCRGGRPGVTYRKPGAELADELSTQELFLLLEQARDFGVKEINLGGLVGEPFCRKDIFDLVRKIKLTGFVGAMTTNGSFLDREAAVFLTECNWDLLLLSFDSCDPVTHHALRPAANGMVYFHRIYEFLGALAELNSNVRVLLNVVITKLNYKSFPDLVVFANKFKNIQSVNVLKLVSAGLVNYEDLALNASELKDFRGILAGLKGEPKLTYVENWANEAEILVSADVKNTAPTEGLSRGCFTNFYILSIDSNGDILQCPQHPVAVPNLNIRTKALKELWINEHWAYRKKMAEGVNCFDGCCTILKEQNLMILKEIRKT